MRLTEPFEKGMSAAAQCRGREELEGRLVRKMRRVIPKAFEKILN
jgi:hypothetical protein